MFVETREAKRRGYRSGRFSFNTKGGRCEECQGQGLRRIEMNFLADLYVVCPVCEGKRFNRQTLEVRYRLQASSDTRSIPVIFVTARTTKESKLEGLDLGAVDFITKPIDLDETLARVQTQLRFAAINRENFDLQRRLEESRRAATIGAVARASPTT